MTDEELAVGIELERIFTPLAHKKRDHVRTNGGRFVHYTSAENAVNIIKNRRIWMRNVRYMNDYREAYHGYDKLLALFQIPYIIEAYQRALAPFGIKMHEKILTQFDQWRNNIQLNTYVCSFSEHDDAEDLHGRLSMWRAYGGDSAKAAIIFWLPLTPGSAVGLRLLVSPVEYMTDADFENEFMSSIRSIEKNADYLRSVDPVKIQNMGFFALVLAALCLKHEGFAEEREWRAIYLPYALPSAHIERSVEVVGGIPQIVYKIPLENKPDEQITGVDIPNLIDKIIVGPSGYPVPISEAFVSLLSDAGIPDSRPRVTVSYIPLRT